MTQKVRANVRRMITLAQVRFWIERIDAHFSHYAPDSFAIYRKSMLHPQKTRYRPISPGGVVCMDSVDESSQFVLVVAYSLL